ncbi:MAG: late competence development ComFB family protein [Candidatus Hodarchaeales archaeon]
MVKRDTKMNYNLDLIKNRSLEIVISRIEKLLNERDDFCHCEVCVIDLIAFVLNNITPLYTTSLLDPFENKKIEIINGEIEKAMKEGIKRIKEHPHHIED